MWEIDGWDGWERLAQRTNVKKADNAELAEWWDEAYQRRTGGFDRLLQGAPGCPTLATLGRRRRWLVVRPRASSRCAPAPEPTTWPRSWTSAVRAMAERGIALVGAYDSVLNDTEVCTIWAADVAAHTALLRDGDPGGRRPHLLHALAQELMTLAPAPCSLERNPHDPHPPTPLGSVRIIECSMLGPGAITTTLADLGADVIKVEPPSGDYIRQMTWPIVEGTSLMHLHISRGKRSITLDLRTEEGREVFLEPVRGADAVIEAMRPGGPRQARASATRPAWP